MGMIRRQAVGILVASLACGSSAVAQSTKWLTPKCDLKPGHYLVNSALLYLRNATDTKFEDQKQKDLRDANRSLTQALTTGGQERNPAAWYYLARYYVMTEDLPGADSAFTRAEALKADCKDDITFWRRFVWVPTINAGIAAWQANNTDSAMRAFRRANAIVRTEPTGFKYLASLLYQAGQIDSAGVYFRQTADIAATDPKYAADRKDALFNLARIHHARARDEQDGLAQVKPDSLSPHWSQALATYREYLTLFPNDADALASVGSVLLQTGRRDSAFAIFQTIIARADSVGSIPLFRAGVEIYTSAPRAPDTVALGRECRTRGQTGRATPPARIRVCRDSMAALMRAHTAGANETYRLAAQAFEAGLKLNPYFRDGLFNMVNTYLTLNDSTKMLPVAQRLYAVDPLSRASIRLLAFSHQRNGRVDSTLHYLRLADSTLAVDVTVTTFDPEEQEATVKGTITNMRPTPNQPFKLVFEFLTAKGDVVATQATDVPALQPQQSQAFELKAIGAAILAWRYHKE